MVFDNTSESCIKITENDSNFYLKLMNNQINT